MSSANAVLEPDEALALIAGGANREALSPLRDTPIVMVRARSSGALDEFSRVARSSPCVIVAVGRSADLLPIADVLVTPEPDVPPPWVGSVGDLELQQLVAAVTAHPAASVALVQLLRLSATLAVEDALVAESMAYGMLQAGPEHAEWLARRRVHRTGHQEADPVWVDRSHGCLTITLCRPHVRNAYNAAMRDGLSDAFAAALADPSIERVELRAEGACFCSGGDLAEFGTRPDPVTAHLVRGTRNPAALLHALANRTVAYVHGSCVGAGVEVPAFAGTVQARRDASFRLPEVAMGLIPGAGGTVSIPRRIGRSRTAWLALTGAPIDAFTALNWGLVDDLA